jgi:ABC-type branched-subunit amino acid transport system ATPase component
VVEEAVSDVVLRTHRLVRRFGGIAATNEVSLEVMQGARHALIGPNGAGKTTLINLLTGVLAPTSGQVELLGHDITALAPHRRVGLGLVRTFQISQLFASFTPLQSLALAVASRVDAARRFWQPMGHDAAIAAECESLLGQFRLLEHAERPTRELPYGKRRLLEIALAVAQRPKVLLLDEPGSRRAGGRARRHSCHRRCAGCRRGGAPDRARHGPRLQLRHAHHGARQWCRAGRRHPGRDRGRRAGQGGVPRARGGGEPCLICCRLST